MMRPILGGLLLVALVGGCVLLEWAIGRAIRFVFVDLIRWIAKQVVRRNPHLREQKDTPEKPGL